MQSHQDVNLTLKPLGSREWVHIPPKNEEFFIYLYMILRMDIWWKSQVFLVEIPGFRWKNSWDGNVQFFFWYFGRHPHKIRDTPKAMFMRNVEQILGWDFQHTSWRGKRCCLLGWFAVSWCLSIPFCVQSWYPWFQHLRFVFEVITPNMKRISPCLRSLFHLFSPFFSDFS